MNGSEQQDQLYAALAQARMSFGTIRKTHTARITSSTANFKYDYAPLEEVFNAIDMALGQAGLTPIGDADYSDDGHFWVITRLGHSSGQWIETRLDVGTVPKTHKEMGTALTYGRRYGLCLLVQVQAEDDDDGERLEGEGKETAATRQPTARHTPPRSHDGLVVDVAPDPDVSQAAPAPATPNPSETPRLPNKAELLDGIHQQRRRLSDQYTDTVILHRGFGASFTSWEQVEKLPAGSLRNPLKRLQAIQTEQPPADPPAGATPPSADGPTPGRPDSAEAAIQQAQVAPFVSSVPGPRTDVPRPASGPETPAPGSTTTPSTNPEEDVPTFPPSEGRHEDGAILDASQNLPDRHRIDDREQEVSGQGSGRDRSTWTDQDAPPAEPEVMSMGPNKGRVVKEYVIALESWAQKVGCLDIFTHQTHGNARMGGVVAMLPEQYIAIREEILSAVPQREMKVY